MRASPVGLGNRKGGMDTEGPGFIGTGGDDPSAPAPLRVGADYDRSTAKPGPVSLFDGSVKGIHVDMDDEAFLMHDSILRPLSPHGKGDVESRKQKKREREGERWMRVRRIDPTRGDMDKQERRVNNGPVFWTRRKT